ncbi:MAG: serine hydrolase, partial [Phycisphaerae bacterium]
MKADYDVDGDLDTRDWEAFSACLSGPDADVDPAWPLTTLDCIEAFNFDPEPDLDLEDVAAFMRRFTGPCSGSVECPSGKRVFHESGATTHPDIDTASLQPPDPNEFVCVDEGSCDPDRCSGHGLCQDEDGVPTCHCDPGYAGAFCERCAVGYEPMGPTATGRGDQVCILGTECRERRCSDQGDCAVGDDQIICICDAGASGKYCENGTTSSTLRPPTRVVISGTDSSIRRGDSRRLSITPFGDGAIATDFTWELRGPGLLDARLGDTVTYIAPSDPGDGRTELVEIIVCTQSFPDHCATRYLTVDTFGGIPTTGQANAAFKPLDDMMRSFMRKRCVGAAVLGVSFFGKVVHLRGFGNLSGAPTDDPDYLEECGDVYDVSDFYPDLPLPPPTPVQPNTPFRIASCSKTVGAAVLRKVIRESGLLGPEPTDTSIESMRLCDPNWDLLPEDVRAVLCGDEPPPVELASASGLFPDCGDDDPCPYGGDCVPVIGDLGVCVDCPEGLGGLDCTISETSCADLGLAADSRWTAVRLRHLLLHTSGLPREGASPTRVLVPRIDTLRDLVSEADWLDEEAALTSECGFPSGCFDDEFPSFDAALAAIEPGFFIRRPTVAEQLLLRGGSCLLADPSDVDRYSNTGFEMISLIAEHVSGQSFAGKAGRPGLHTGSALEAFLQDALGLPLDGQATDQGMLFSDTVLRLREETEPIYRHWVQSVQTYYPLAWDDKRAHCTWDGSDCNFGDWISGDERFDWDFGDPLTLLPYARSEWERLGGRGGLATEAEVYLEYMSRFWVGNKSGTNPSYGETRCPNGNCDWSTFVAHNGSLDGTSSQALQLGGGVRTTRSCNSDADCFFGERCLGPTGSSRCVARNTYKLPSYDPCLGDFSDNFGELVTHRCHFPAGVDIFIAVNQRRDRKCVDAESLPESHPEYYTCSTAYGLLDDFIYHGVCNIDWPPNPFVFWPPVEGGGSGMTLTIGGAGRDGAQPSGGGQRDVFPQGLPCCGDGVKEGGEACDGTDFGGSSCGSYGFAMGDLNCVANCGTIDTSGCSGGQSNIPPASYGNCGYTAEDCDNNPALCFADGDCLGGPCARTDVGDYQYARIDPFNFQGEFHPDGDFTDQQGNLYYCRDDAGEGEMVCVNVNGWGVCKACQSGNQEVSTGIGCSCSSESDCENLDNGLGCFGEETGPGIGFCWDENDGPPPWQCAEGTCGTAPWYGDDETYCEHYSTSGQARCQPWFACNPILARVCAGENLICEENALGCTDDDCCTSACQQDSDCTQAFGWPPG